MVYYSGQAFTNKIETEVKKLSSNGVRYLSDDVIAELKKLDECLNQV